MYFDFLHIFNYFKSYWISGGFKFLVGSGDSNVWGAPWLVGGPLGPRLPYIHISDTNFRIKDLFEDNSWKLDKLHTPIPEAIAKEFKGFGPLVTHPEAMDGWGWGDPKCPSYTVRSGYNFIIRNFTPPARSWLSIWRLPAPEKVQLLIWLIVHDALPTNKLRYERKLSSNPLCTTCGFSVESWWHAIF